MQPTNNTPALANLVIATGDNTDAGDATPILAVPAKPAKAAKPAKPAKPAKLPAAQKPAAKPETTDIDMRRAEREAGRIAIADYYSGIGKSIPFKSASDTFAEIRLDKQPKAPTVRQAALLAAMLCAGDNIDKRGQFKRGGFIHDGKRVQPETGCLSDMLGRTVFHVNGPLSGKHAIDATFRIDLKRARAEIQAALGDKLGKAAIAKLDKLAPAKPAKAA